MTKTAKPPVLIRFLDFVKPYWQWVCLASLAGILRYLIPLAVPWALKIYIDELLSKSPTVEIWWKVHALALIIFVCYLIWALATYVRIYATGLSGNRIIFNLRSRLFLHLQQMSLDYFEQRKIGAITSRLTQDVNVAQQLIGQGVTAAFMDLTSVFVITVIMLRIHAGLALVSVSLIPIYWIVSRHYSRKVRRASHEVHERQEEIAGNLHEKMSGISLVHSFVRERKEEKVFLAGCEHHFKAVLNNVRTQALGLTVLGFLAGIAPVFVLWYGALGVMAGSITIGMLTAFYGYIGLLYFPVSRLTELQMVTAGALASLERIFEVLDTEPRVVESKQAVAVSSFKGKISFRGVVFGYHPENPLFRGLNFEIEPGESAAFVGPNGSGKSTLVKLLLRFYEIQGGEILIDDYKIRDITLASLRQSIGLLNQEPILFSGTIMENILYGDPAASYQKAVEAALTAHAHDFISHLPRQYETEVGERGLKLSPGQKQKIAMARTILKNPKILVLDEPATALDEASKAIVEENIKELRKDRTTLLISHDPAALQDVDRCFYLENGTLFEKRGAMAGG